MNFIRRDSEFYWLIKMYFTQKKAVKSLNLVLNIKNLCSKV